MSPQGSRVPPRHLRHDSLALLCPLQTEDRLWEVQRLLDCPDPVMIGRWQSLRRVAHRNPTNRHSGIRWYDRLQVNDAVDPHLRSGTDAGSVEDGGPGGEERVVLDSAPGEVRAWSDEDVI